MSDMSDTFLQAYSISDYNKEQSLKLYEHELKANPGNFVAWHNKGIIKLKIADETNNKILCNKAIEAIKKSIALADADGKGEFTIAKNNLEWANETLTKIAKMY